MARQDHDHQDHDRVLRWLDEALDGELDSSRSEALEAHLDECADCRQDRESFLRLRGLLSEDRVDVAPGFTARVIESLPTAAWETRPRSSFRLAVALLFLFASSSVLLLSSSAASEAAPFSILGSVVDLLATTALAGAGLLGATWRGLGLALHDLLTGSPATLLAYAATLVAIHLLLWRLMRPRQKARASSEPGDFPRQGDRLKG